MTANAKSHLIGSAWPTSGLDEDDNGRPPPSDPTDNTTQVTKLRQAIADTFDQALAISERWPNADITIVTDYLMFSAQALEKPGQTDLELAKAYYARAKMWCARLNRKESDERAWDGFWAITIQFIYLGLLIFWATNFYGSRLNLLPLDLPWLDNTADIARATIRSTEAIGIPFYALVWGFLGGIAWCLYSATYWMGKGLFNSNYFGWYVALPFISALLGAATSTVILAGYTAVAVPEADAAGSLTQLPFAVVATLCLVSFVAGYSARSIWKLLDRTMRKIFKDDAEVQNVQSSVGRSLSKSTLEQQIR